MNRFCILLLTSFSVLIFSQGCKKEDTKTETLLIDRPIAPILLEAERTLIYLDDFLPDSIIADSVFVDGERADFYQNNKTILHRVSDVKPIKPIIVMKVWAGGKSADILLKRSERINYLFLFDPKGANYQSVQLKGNFNGWVPSETVLTQENGIWGVMLKLNRGKYEYLVVADGKEMMDPNNPKTISNGQGGNNSVLEVGKPFGTEPVLLTESYDDQSFTIKVKNSLEKVFVLWNNELLDTSLIQIKESIIKVQIPEKSKHFKSSTIRVFGYNETGAGNDLLIPLFNGKISADPKDLASYGHQGKIVYNVFVDRFFDGDTTNNYRLPDSEVLPPANWHGGDLAGVKKKIEEGYFNTLGVNTLWLSPVVQNVEGAYGYWPEPESKFSAYHGYWPVSFTKIDRHFGSSDDLKAMVNQAHESGLKILVDYVANHVHEEHPLYKSNPKVATSMYLPDGRLNLELWDEARLTTWFDKFLPTLDLENQDIANMLADSVLWWVKEYNLDGFRYDAAKHVPLTFWRNLTDKLTDQWVAAANGELYQLGETYGSAELIGSYLGAGLLDAQFDFNLYDAGIGAFARGENFTNLTDRLMESMRYYGSHHAMGNITGNQDRGRFISYAGGSLKFDENPKVAGWTRKIDVGDSIGYDKLIMLMAFNMTIPGVPVIYYGDEFGMPGGNDPDSRRMMRFGDDLNAKEKANLETTKALIQIRNNSPALLFGDFCRIQTGEQFLVYSRRYFDTLAIVAFNNSNVEQEISIDLSEYASNQEFSTYPKTDFKKTDKQISFTLKPWSFIIFTN